MPTVDPYTFTARGTRGRCSRGWRRSPTPAPSGSAASSASASCSCCVFWSPPALLWRLSRAVHVARPPHRHRVRRAVRGHRPCGASARTWSASSGSASCGSRSTGPFAPVWLVPTYWVWANTPRLVPARRRARLPWCCWRTRLARPRRTASGPTGPRLRRGGHAGGVIGPLGTEGPVVPAHRAHAIRHLQRDRRVEAGDLHVVRPAPVPPARHGHHPRAGATADAGRWRCPRLPSCRRRRGPAEHRDGDHGVRPGSGRDACRHSACSPSRRRPNLSGPMSASASSTLVGAIGFAVLSPFGDLGQYPARPLAWIQSSPLAGEHLAAQDFVGNFLEVSRRGRGRGLQRRSVRHAPAGRGVRRI